MNELADGLACDAMYDLVSKETHQSAWYARMSGHGTFFIGWRPETVVLHGRPTRNDCPIEMKKSDEPFDKFTNGVKKREFREFRLR